MFDFIRSHTKLAMFGLVLLIIPSFVLFGLQGYSKFTDPSTETVAQVGSRKISRGEWDAAHRQQSDRLRQQMPGIDAKILDSSIARQQSLDGLLRETLLATAAEKQHLAVSNDRLQRLFVSDPQFAQLRRPDGSINRELLESQGMSVAQFEERLRREFSLRQVTQGIEGSKLLPAGNADVALDALLQQREVQLQRFAATTYEAQVKPNDADIEAYYKAHSAQFKSPEEADIEYVVLDLASLQQQVLVNEEDLRKYYNENQSRYTAAEERRASHILIGADKSAPAADRQKAKAKAESLLAELRKNPASFADVAKKNSTDTGSAERGGDLDFFGRGAMVKPFEDAAFAMKQGEISNVVESDFGYHIIQLTGVRGGERKPFEAVRAEIDKEVRRQLAQQRYAEAAEQFSNTVYEQADSLQPVIDKLKLTKQTAKVRRTTPPGAEGPLASQKLLDAIYSPDSLRTKRNTEAVETGTQQLTSARIVAHRPERVLPLAEVKEQVLQAVKHAQAAAAARKDGEARLAAVLKNPAEPLPQTVVLSRLQPQGQARPVVEAALRADATKLPSAVGVDLEDEGYVVLRVTKVLPRDAKAPEAAQGKSYVSQTYAAAEGQAYFEALKKRYDAKIKDGAVAAAAAEPASAPATGTR